MCGPLFLFCFFPLFVNVPGTVGVEHPDSSTNLGADSIPCLDQKLHELFVAVRSWIVCTQTSSFTSSVLDLLSTYTFTFALITAVLFLSLFHSASQIIHNSQYLTVRAIIRIQDSSVLFTFTIWIPALCSSANLCNRNSTRAGTFQPCENRQG
jgi:hypothetical protein